MSAGEEPTTYAHLNEMHSCEVPAEKKSAVFTIMEDGSVALIIGQHDGAGAWRVFEHLTMKRDDFNVWLHQIRQWWIDEKLHPTARPPHG